MARYRALQEFTDDVSRIRVLKIDAVTKKPLAGVSFGLYTQAGEQLQVQNQQRGHRGVHRGTGNLANHRGFCFERIRSFRKNHYRGGRFGLYQRRPHRSGKCAPHTDRRRQRFSLDIPHLGRLFAACRALSFFFIPAK